MHVEGLLYTFSASEIPGFSEIAAASRRACIIPDRIQQNALLELPDDHPLAQLRRELDHPPLTDAFLERETEEWQMGFARIPKHAEQNYEANDVRSAVVPVAGSTERLNDLFTAVMEYFGEFCQMQGDFYYPPGGFRTWHTNKYNTPGWRMYLVDVDEEDKSFFRFIDPKTGEMKTIWDKRETVNFFRIDPDQLFWHCIGSVSTNRWSKGFVVPESWQQKILY